MGIFDNITSLFSGGISKAVDSVTGLLDNVITTDEERDQAKIELQKTFNELEAEQLELLHQYEKEITERHKTDMMSDSWLSKNIRPLVMAFLVLAVTLLAYVTIFAVEPDMQALVDDWIGFFTTIMVTVVTFYFGSRGIEKVQKIRIKKEES